VGAVGGRGHDRDPAIDDAADRLVEGVAVGEAAVAVVGTGLRDAHVDRLEERPVRVVRVALGEDPVQAADVPGDQAVAIVVEDLDRPHTGARGDADDTEAVVDRRYRARDMRP
jgi:hypothetical protein